MPIHDWTKVEAGLFHSFHQRWISSLSDILNFGVLPPDYFALAEQRVEGPIPDLLTLRLATGEHDFKEADAGGLAVATAPPKTSFVQRSDEEIYAGKADRITIRHPRGDVVAVIEIVSPGNKSSTSEINAFVRKAVEWIRVGVHVMIIDLFPPNKRNPTGIHGLIWDQFDDEEYAPPADKPLTLVSYVAGSERVAYIEPFAAGDVLKDMPLFLRPEYYVPTPLEKSYMATWEMFPNPMKKIVQA